MKTWEYITVEEASTSVPIHISKAEIAAFSDYGPGSIIYLRSNSNGFAVRNGYEALRKWILEETWDFGEPGEFPSRYISVTHLDKGSVRHLHIEKRELAAFSPHEQGAIIYMAGNPAGFVVKESYSEVSRMILDDTWSEA